MKKLSTLAISMILGATFILTIVLGSMLALFVTPFVWAQEVPIPKAKPCVTIEETLVKMRKDGKVLPYKQITTNNPGMIVLAWIDGSAIAVQITTEGCIAGWRIFFDESFIQTPEQQS